jgi:hypothetical protein
MTLGMVGQVGLWSIGLFTPELVRGSLLAQRQSELAGVVTGDKGVNALPPLKWCSFWATHVFPRLR